MGERIAMKMGVGIGTELGLTLLAGAISLLQAQSGGLTAGVGPGSTAPAPHFSVSSQGAIVPVSGQILRIIDDPGTGHRWLLLSDESHPGGPGKLVLSSDEGLQTVRTHEGGVSPHTDATSPMSPAISSQLASSLAGPVIHAGDHLSVEQHTAVSDVQLAATALGPAAKGSTFNIRLEIGGRVMRAIAEGPGHASFAPRIEGQP